MLGCTCACMAVAMGTPTGGLDPACPEPRPRPAVPDRPPLLSRNAVAETGAPLARSLPVAPLLGVAINDADSAGRAAEFCTCECPGGDDRPRLDSWCGRLPEAAGRAYDAAVARSLAPPVLTGGLAAGPTVVVVSLGVSCEDLRRE